MALGVGVWQSVINGYDVPYSLPSDLHGRRLYDQNAKVVDSLFPRITMSEFIKVMHCRSAKQIWDKLQNVYQGDTKVQRAKLQVYISYYESIKMQEEE